MLLHSARKHAWSGLGYLCHIGDLSNARRSNSNARLTKCLEPCRLIWTRAMASLSTSFIVSLFFPRGPFAIAWAIVAIIVNALNRQTLWFSPHVGKEIFE